MIYAFHGEAYSGKTTSAKKLMWLMSGKKGLFKDYTPLSFANGPKAVVATITGLQDKNAPLPPAWRTHDREVVRDLIIDVAEGLKGVMGEDVWAKALLSRFQSGVIDDLRFPIEASLLDMIPNIKIRVLCSEATRYNRAAKFGDPEQLLRSAGTIPFIQCDFTIDTDGDVDFQLERIWSQVR